MNTQNYAGQISGATPVEPSALKVPLIKLVITPGEVAEQVYIALSTRRDQLVRELFDSTLRQNAEEVVMKRESLVFVDELLQDLFLDMNFACESMAYRNETKEHNDRRYRKAVDELIKETGWNS